MALAHARTCYRHLAGRLAVACLVALEQQRLVLLRDGAIALSAEGMARFEALGLSPRRTWPTGKPCLDWTERLPHLGGPLGVVLGQHLLEIGWLVRREEPRALRVTAAGRAGFRGLGLPSAVLG